MLNGAGTYTLPSGNPVVSGTTISSSVQNNTMTDIANTLSNAMYKDGQSTPTANLKMGNFKLTGLAAGTNAGDSVRYDEFNTLNSSVSALQSTGTIGFKNRIINGAMAVAQRGTQSGSPLSGYTLDRWLFSRSGSGSSTVSQSSTQNYGGQYALNISSAHAAGEVFGIEQRIESANSYDLAGKTITVQFYANATTSAGALGSFAVALAYANATDNFSSVTSIGSVSFTPTSTPTLFTAQFSVPSAATTGLKLIFSGGQTVATGTITFNLGGVQLEKGSTATSFDYRPYGTELALCQRYLPAFNGASNFFSGQAFNSTGTYTQIVFPVTTRVAPTGMTTSAVSGSNFITYNNNGSGLNVTALTYVFSSTNTALITTTVASGLTAGNAAFTNITGANGQILFTGCEL